MEGERRSLGGTTVENALLVQGKLSGGIGLLI